MRVDRDFVVIVLSIFVAIILASSAAEAHGTWGYDWWPAIKQHRRKAMTRKTHRVFRNHANAHEAMLRMDCESQFRWWLRGRHWGTEQSDRDFRNSYAGKPWWDGYPFLEQLVTHRNGHRARGNRPWPNCPDEQRGQR